MESFFNHRLHLSSRLVLVPPRSLDISDLGILLLQELNVDVLLLIRTTFHDHLWSMFQVLIIRLGGVRPRSQKDSRPVHQLPIFLEPRAGRESRPNLRVLPRGEGNIHSK